MAKSILRRWLLLSMCSMHVCANVFFGLPGERNSNLVKKNRIADLLFFPKVELLREGYKSQQKAKSQSCDGKSKRKCCQSKLVHFSSGTIKYQDFCRLFKLQVDYTVNQQLSHLIKNTYDLHHEGVVYG